MWGHLERDIRRIPGVLACTFTDEEVVVLVGPEIDAPAIAEAATAVLIAAQDPRRVRVAGGLVPVAASISARPSARPAVLVGIIAATAAIGLGSLVGGWLGAGGTPGPQALPAPVIVPSTPPAGEAAAPSPPATSLPPGPPVTPGASSPPAIGTPSGGTPSLSEMVRAVFPDEPIDGAGPVVAPTPIEGAGAVVTLIPIDAARPAAAPSPKDPPRATTASRSTGSVRIAGGNAPWRRCELHPVIRILSRGKGAHRGAGPASWSHSIQLRTFPACWWGRAR